jgi:hypothetical protein
MVAVEKSGPKRLYCLTRLEAGDYLLPSNDGRTLWRIRSYEDGPSHGVEEWPRDRMVWGVWRWLGRIGPAGIGGDVDVDDWSRWDFTEGTHDTRAESIKRALEIRVTR